MLCQLVIPWAIKIRKRGTWKAETCQVLHSFILLKESNKMEVERNVTRVGDLRSRKVRTRVAAQDGLTRLLQRYELDMDGCYVVVEEKRKAGYILCLGQIVSPLCFISGKPSRSYKDMDESQLWQSVVIPDGWKFACVVDDRPWTAEARVIDGKLQFGFHQVDNDGIEAEVLKWAESPTEAFKAQFEHVFTGVLAPEDLKKKLKSVNGKLYFGCHYSNVQRHVRAYFEDLQPTDSVMRSLMKAWMANESLPVVHTSPGQSVRAKRLTSSTEGGEPTKRSKVTDDDEILEVFSTVQQSVSPDDTVFGAEPLFGEVEVDEEMFNFDRLNSLWDPALAEFAKPDLQEMSEGGSSPEDSLSPPTWLEEWMAEVVAENEGDNKETRHSSGSRSVLAPLREIANADSTRFGLQKKGNYCTAKDDWNSDEPMTSKAIFAFLHRSKSKVADIISFDAVDRIVSFAQFLRNNDGSLIDAPATCRRTLFLAILYHVEQVILRDVIDDPRSRLDYYYTQLSYYFNQKRNPHDYLAQKVFGRYAESHGGAKHPLEEQIEKFTREKKQEQKVSDDFESFPEHDERSATPPAELVYEEGVRCFATHASLITELPPSDLLREQRC